MGHPANKRKKGETIQHCRQKGNLFTTLSASLAAVISWKSLEGVKQEFSKSFCQEINDYGGLLLHKMPYNTHPHTHTHTYTYTYTCLCNRILDSQTHPHLHTHTLFWKVPKITNGYKWLVLNSTTHHWP